MALDLAQTASENGGLTGKDILFSATTTLSGGLLSSVKTPSTVRNQLIDGATDNKAVKNAVTDSVTDNKAVKNAADDVVEVSLSRSKYPESAKHIEDAIGDGHPDTLTIDRGGAKTNRSQSLKGTERVPGKDRDEYPPAMFKEGGAGASVRPISRSDNRGAGSTIGHQLRPYSDGTKVKIVITE